MDRYVKYLDIIRKADSALEKNTKLLEGRVTPENLAMVEKLLCLIEKAWNCCWIVDRMDDIEEGTRKISEKGQGPDTDDMQSYMRQRQGGQPQGNDFRGGREDSGFEAWSYGGNTARVRQTARGAHEMNDPRGEHMAGRAEEENRRGVAGTGHIPYARQEYGTAHPAMAAMYNAMEAEENRRGRSPNSGQFVHRPDARYLPQGEMDFMFPNLGIPGFYSPRVHPFWGRMGFGADPREDNRMYNGVQLPLQNAGQDAGMGNAMNGVQLPIQNAMDGNNGHTGNAYGAQNVGQAGTSNAGTAGANNAAGIPQTAMPAAK